MEEAELEDMDDAIEIEEEDDNGGRDDDNNGPDLGGSDGGDDNMDLNDLDMYAGVDVWNDDENIYDNDCDSITQSSTTIGQDKNYWMGY